jgi:hypothetical protein
MIHRAAFAVVGIVAGIAAMSGLGAERKRPPLPKITQPVLFGTPEADRILAAMQVFPPDMEKQTGTGQDRGPVRS